MKLGRLKLFIIMLLVIGILLTALPFTKISKADFGDSNDYSGGDSGGYSGGSDYSYDSDSGDGEGSSLISFIILIVIVIIIFSGGNKNNKNHNNSNPSSYNNNVNNNQNTYSDPNQSLSIAKLVMAKDPKFSHDDFISFAKRSFVDIQLAWSNRNLDPVRGILYSNLYEQTNRQVQQKINDGIVNKLERIAVTNAYLTKYYEDATDEYLNVHIDAQMVDYQVRERDNRVIAGDTDKLWHLHYNMIMRRKKGVLSGSINLNNVRASTCPCCGAPLTMNAYGKCEYCDSIINTGDYTWVISELKPIR